MVYKTAGTILPVTIHKLQKEGLKIAEELLINTKDDPKFQASRGWADNFMERFSISLRRQTHIGQKLSSGSIQLAKLFVESFNKLIETNKYPLEAICNTDQTPIYTTPAFK